MSSPAGLPIVVGAYWVVAAITSLSARSSKRLGDRTFWAAVSCFLFFLGAAKHFRLQGILTNEVRTVARDLGVYDYRQGPQFVILLAIVLGIALLWKPARSRLACADRTLTTAVVAVTALSAFILVRALSIHVIDPVLTKLILGIRVGWWVELIALGAIAASAAAYGRRQFD